MQNNKAAGRRLVVELSLCHQKILERAKGFEPSTPTLARSCSTTELHPHPRDWRRSLTGNAQSYAKCGPRMQQSARDLRIGRIGRYREVLRVNQPETSCERPPGSSVAASGNPAGRLAIVLRGDSSHLPNEPRSVPVSSSRRPVSPRRRILQVCDRSTSGCASSRCRMRLSW